MGIVLILILISCSTYYYFNKEEQEVVISSDIEEFEKLKAEDEEIELEQKNKKEYKVDIKGEVITPGIYQLTNDKRVIDVINMAGGLTKIADTSVINLSKKISDEMVIIIYTKDQVLDFAKTKEIEAQVNENCVSPSDELIKNDACIESSEEVINNKVSLNKGSMEDFLTLPGIGESKAQDIIDYRTTNGEFKELEDLMNVTGIGEATFAKLKENITL